MPAWLTFQRVSLTYESMSRPLIEGLSVAFPTGWTGIVGANGAGKSTILRLATGELHPDAGRIGSPGNAIYCAQRTDEAPPALDALLRSEEPHARALQGRLRLSPAWVDRWTSLSHGERKRAQIAVALWRSPLVLAIDEPTNDIDAEARGLLLDALRSFPGIGLLVSHDRPFLSRLTRMEWLIQAEGLRVEVPDRYDGSLEIAP